ncbi:hypothetical protein TH66_22995 [Carbonactinospora thermoautotrophica]|uniref:PPE family domain-containing protein n=2 Tax=Carbonactinospora thermoautotrophica TaxID=1469144 RepID=A0A132MK40_9ACTN|nr:WXG100 family type VII secretion target [Carbonactinospora thermoautotrophica]KWW98125.1 hypothetical protein TH66_22995 [Carbonactinospora thermoautotrophica]
MSEFASRSHDELYAMIKDADPGTLREAERRWRAVADRLQNLAADLRSQAAGLQHSWSGQAADQFQGVAAQVAERTRSLGEKAATVSTAMRTAGDALETAKARMPEPPSDWERSLVSAGKMADKYGFVGGVAGFLGGKLAGEAAEAKQAEFEQKRREAVQVMEQLDAAYAASCVHLAEAGRYEDGAPAQPAEPPGGTTGGGSGTAGGGVSAYRSGGGAGGGGYSGYGTSGGGSRVSATPTVQGTDSGIIGGVPIGSDLSSVGTLPGIGTTMPGGGLSGTGGLPGGGLGGVLFPMPGGPLGGGAWDGGRMPGRTGGGYGGQGFRSGPFGDGVDGGRLGGGGRMPGASTGGRGLAGVGDDGIIGGRPGSRNGAGGVGNGMPDGPDGLGRGGGHGSDEEERERGKRPSWLVEDAETWANKKSVVPPVIS